MSTPETSTHSRARWAVPVTAAVIGVGYLVAGVAGDNTGFGIFGLCLMLAVAGGFLVLGTRSETVAGLVNRRDERINAIDRDASLASGGVLIVAVIVIILESHVFTVYKGGIGPIRGVTYR